MAIISYPKFIEWRETMDLHKYKKYSLFLLFILITIFMIGCKKEETELIVEETKLNAEETEPVVEEIKSPEDFAADFVLSTFSDLSDHSKPVEYFVDSESTALLEFMKDRAEVNKLKDELYGVGAIPISNEIVKSMINQHDDGTTEVFFTIMHKFLTGGNEGGMQAVYKVVVDEDKPMRVIAAMANDFSGGTLMGNIKGSYDELNTDYQLDSSANKPYDLEEILEGIRIQANANK